MDLIQSGILTKADTVQEPADLVQRKQPKEYPGFFETIKDTAVATADVTAGLASGIMAYIPQKAIGTTSFLFDAPGGITPEEKVSRARQIEEITGELFYQPKTNAGKKYMDMIGKAFDFVLTPVHKVASKVEKTHPKTGYLIGIIGEFAELGLLHTAGKKIIKGKKLTAADFKKVSDKVKDKADADTIISALKDAEAEQIAKPANTLEAKMMRDALIKLNDAKKAKKKMPDKYTIEARGMQELIKQHPEQFKAVLSNAEEYNQIAKELGIDLPMTVTPKVLPYEVSTRTGAEKPTTPQPTTFREKVNPERLAIEQQLLELRNKPTPQFITDIKKDLAIREERQGVDRLLTTEKVREMELAAIDAKRRINISKLPNRQAKLSKRDMTELDGIISRAEQARTKFDSGFYAKPVNKSMAVERPQEELTKKGQWEDGPVDLIKEGILKPEEVKSAVEEVKVEPEAEIIPEVKPEVPVVKKTINPPKRESLLSEIKSYNGTLTKSKDFKYTGEWNATINNKNYKFSSQYNKEVAKWWYQEEGKDWEIAGEFPSEFIPKIIEPVIKPSVEPEMLPSKIERSINEEARPVITQDLPPREAATEIFKQYQDVVKHGEGDLTTLESELLNSYQKSDPKQFENTYEYDAYATAVENLLSDIRLRKEKAVKENPDSVYYDQEFETSKVLPDETQGKDVYLVNPKSNQPWKNATIAKVHMEAKGINGQVIPDPLGDGYIFKVSKLNDPGVLQDVKTLFGGERGSVSLKDMSAAKQAAFERLAEKSRAAGQKISDALISLGIDPHLAFDIAKQLGEGAKDNENSPNKLLAADPNKVIKHRKNSSKGVVSYYPPITNGDLRMLKD
ncbi:MAG: hypothetical protein M0R51_16700, partial [Clostridia bacterium]|nr:hypothetical protein [Clostridia bacterium]